MKNFIVGALIIGVFVLIGAAMIGNGRLGASSGPEHFNQEYFYGGLVQGGEFTTLTAGGTVTITAKQVCDSSILKWVATYPTTATATLPTSAALISACLPKIGDFKDIHFYNASANTSNTVAFTLGTHMASLNTASTTATPGFYATSIQGGNWSGIRLMHYTASSVLVFFEQKTAI